LRFDFPCSAGETDEKWGWQFVRKSFVRKDLFCGNLAEREENFNEICSESFSEKQNEK
jgi:hypothetical protein